MQIEFVKENADGSAVYTFDMTPEEKNSLVLYGIKCALENAAKEAETWNPENLPEDSEEIHAGLSD
jgi:hypothetical protein